MTEDTNPESLRDVLRGHFAPCPPDGLVVSRRSGRVTPTFIRELMRRAAQAMLDRGGESTLEACDVELALSDMLKAGGKPGAGALGAQSAVGFSSDNA